MERALTMKVVVQYKLREKTCILDDSHTCSKSVMIASIVHKKVDCVDIFLYESLTWTGFVK